MVSGFANTSADFPVPNELASKISEFYKCACLDKFFDLLSDQELTIKGVIYFYTKSFSETQNILNKHFEPALSCIQKTGCFDSIEGPIMNVLRKAYQTTYKKILQEICTSGKFTKVAKEIQNTLEMSE